MDKRPAVIFDIDGTWYRWQLFLVWIEEAIHQGVLPRIVLTIAEEARDAYDKRQGSWDEFVDRQVSAYQGEMRLAGVRVSDAVTVAKEVIRKKGKRVHVFTRELAYAAEQACYERAVISGSPREVVAAFAAANSIPHYLGTEHPTKDGIFLGGLPMEHSRDKGAAVRLLASQRGIDLRESVAIGDSPSDAAMLELVKWRICFNPNRALLDIARTRKWTVVFEKKDACSIFIPDDVGRLCEATCRQILPEQIASILEMRIADRLWRHPTPRYLARSS